MAPAHNIRFTSEWWRPTAEAAEAKARQEQQEQLAQRDTFYGKR